SAGSLRVRLRSTLQSPRPRHTSSIALNAAHMGGTRGGHKRAWPSLAVRPFAMLGARLTSAGPVPASAPSGRSSGVEHNLAKVGVEGSNPFARSSFLNYLGKLLGQ